MAEAAYRMLKIQIAAGDMPAGQRLMPNALAAELGTGASHIKEALRRLAQEGIVETTPGRGTVVRRLRRTEIIHIYGLRALIERHALRTGFAVGSGLAKLARDMDREQRGLLAALGRGTVGGLTEALAHDRALHASLVAQTGNPFMIQSHAHLMARTHSVHLHTLQTFAADLLRREHEAVIAAIRAKDLAAAEAALIHHLDRSQDELVGRAPSREES